MRNIQSSLRIFPIDSLVPREDKATSDVANDNAEMSITDEEPIADVVSISLDDAEEIRIPPGSMIDDATAHPSDPRMFFSCSGYINPARIYQYTFKPQINGVRKGKGGPTKFGDITIWRDTKVAGFDPDNWMVQQVWVPNPNDGVLIPMFMVKPKSLTKTGDAFCHLYGYPITLQ
jgi:hypothetical protein